MTLDIEALKSGIREFNSSRDQYCLADFALHQVFAGELTETTVPLRVLSVNYFYYVNVDKERGAQLAECERIINNLDVVRNAVQLISRLELPCQEEAERTIRRSAIKILP